MHSVEFTTELGPEPILNIPREIADQLPKAGAARIIVVTGGDAEEAEWRMAAYEQFMRDDSPEDAVYDNY